MHFLLLLFRESSIEGPHVPPTKVAFIWLWAIDSSFVIVLEEKSVLKTNPVPLYTRVLPTISAKKENWSHANQAKLQRL
uniref:Uncharacterized protein n=1 Tax=Acrobeloides nanus TaxID=290746 RepID=A0A914E2N6_9BILA